MIIDWIEENAPLLVAEFGIETVKKFKKFIDSNKGKKLPKDCYNIIRDDDNDFIVLSPKDKIIYKGQFSEFLVRLESFDSSGNSKPIIIKNSHCSIKHTRHGRKNFGFKKDYAQSYKFKYNKSEVEVVFKKTSLFSKTKTISTISIYGCNYRCEYLNSNKALAKFYLLDELIFETEKHSSKTMSIKCSKELYATDAILFAIVLDMYHSIEDFRLFL